MQPFHVSVILVWSLNFIVILHYYIQYMYMYTYIDAYMVSAKKWERVVYLSSNTCVYMATQQQWSIEQEWSQAVWSSTCKTQQRCVRSYIGELFHIPALLVWVTHCVHAVVDWLSTTTTRLTNSRLSTTRQQRWHYHDFYVKMLQRHSRSSLSSLPSAVCLCIHVYSVLSTRLCRWCMPS